MSQRIPSLFKVAKNKKFNYEPMYYDPIKEEVRERENRIKRELQIEKGELPEGYSYHASHNIRGAFRQGRTRRRDSSGMLVTIIFLILLGSVAAFIYFPDYAIYILLLIVPLYIFIRRSKSFRS